MGHAWTRINTPSKSNTDSQKGILNLMNTLAHTACNIISIETFKRRAYQHIQWTNVMTTAPQGSPELAYLLGPNNTKHLVLCRDYGDITGILLDDAEIDETNLLRIPTKHYAEFLEPFSKTLIVPGMDAEYNALDMYLSYMNRPVLGPLTSARVITKMREHSCSPAVAVQMTTDERNSLIANQIARLKTVDMLMNNPQAEHRS